jgi:general stress protein 26
MATATYEEQIEKPRNIVKDIEYCRLTTIAENGILHGRPMSTNGEIEPNGDLWFFIYANSTKVQGVGKTKS